MKEEDRLSQIVVNCALKVHRELGPGLLESTYEVCLAHELRNAGLKIETQKSLPVVYDGIQLDAGYRIDILVEGILVLELKSVEALSDLHLAQVLTYLKLSKYKLGLLMNFNVKYIKNGINRVVNGL